MVLTIQDRGMLEVMIDMVIKQIKTEKNLILDPKVKQAFHLQTPEDFLYGMLYGELNNTISNYFTTFKGQKPDLVELQEITEVVLKRLPEIRNAIYFVE